MRQISGLLVMLLLLCLLKPAAFAEEELNRQPVTISTAEDFIRFSQNCSRDTYSRGVTFSLSADIDLGNTDFESVPYFAGTFLGNGHTIRGVAVRESGSRMGLFRQLAQEGSIQNLHAEGAVEPSGTRFHVGGIVGENLGTVDNCSFSGSVRGLENVGGIVGTNGETGSVIACRFQGDVQGEHQVGGIAGENLGLLEDGSNFGSVNTVSIIPEQTPTFDISAVSEDDFLNLSNIGGICGENRGVVQSCRNEGPVGYKNTAYNVGGIAGKNYGYLHDCENRGPILGRRDVGGISGQLIPFTNWIFSNEKLESLASAISYLQVLLGNMTENLDGVTAGLDTQLQTMNGYALQAVSSLNGIIQSLGGIDWSITGQVGYDPDTGMIDFPADISISWADTTGLTDALNNLYLQSGVLVEAMGGAVGTAAEDVKSVARQIGYIFSLLGGVLGDLENGELLTTTDLSITETYEHDEGAIDSCRNFGEVRAENNSGGVTGTIGFEVSFDMENRLDASRFLTSSAKQYLFAAVRDCCSYGEITSRLDGAGGIVGSMDLGAVVNCAGTGTVSSQSGDYVGGILGTGKGTVSSCWSRSSLSGGKYVGGIAGLGDQILDCRAWTYVDRADEYKGAVAGWAEGEVRDNLYVEGKPAGVDNVSLTGQTDAVSEAEMLALEGAPEGFDLLTVRFVANGETIQEIRVPVGGSIEELPSVENDGLLFWKWNDFDREHIYQSLVVEGKYYSPGTTVASEEEIPLFLVEGVFYEGQKLNAEPWPVNLPGEEVIGAYRLSVDGMDGELTVRMHCTEPARLYLLNEEGVYRVTEYRKDGQYIVFPMKNGGVLALTRLEQAEVIRNWVPAAGGGAAALLLIVILFAAPKKRRKTAKTSKDAGT